MRRFDEWFDETEAYVPRYERFFDLLEEHLLGNSRSKEILDWLKAAYEEGYNQATYDVMKLYWDDGK